jgi:peptidoglycan/LPS O-acetylase OafA/YrhL
VALFFVVSGFCIHAPQVRKQLQGVDASLDLGAFFRRRFVRLYPTHLVALVVSILLAALWPWAYPEGRPLLSVTTPSQFGAHVFMVHSFLPSAIHSGNSVLWTLAVETHFYLLYPLVLWMRRRVPLAWIVIAAWAIGEVLNVASSRLHLYPLSSNFPCRWWEWLLGALIAEEVLRRRPRVRIGLFPLVALALASIQLLVLVETLPSGLRLSRTLQTVTCAAFVGLAVWSRPTAHLAARVLAGIGEESYSLYLVHGFAIHLVVAHLAMSTHSKTTLEIVACLAMVPVVHVFFRLVEKPFLLSAARIAGPTVRDPAR